MKNHKVEVIDNNFNILKIVTRDEVIKDNLKHKTALVIVKNSKNQIYVNQRKKTKELFPLKWVVGAGGAVHAGETYDEAAKRELKEELGISSPIKFLFNFDYQSDITNYKAKVYLTEYDGEINLNKDESEQGKWVSLEELEILIKKGLLCPDTALYIKKYIKDYLEIN